MYFGKRGLVQLGSVQNRRWVMLNSKTKPESCGLWKQREREREPESGFGKAVENHIISI